MIEEHNIPEELDLVVSNDAYQQLDLNIDADALQSVEIQIEKIAERQRQITARLQIPHSVDKVWKVLTDYEALADFIPNLAKSRLLKHPEGGIRLEQVGAQRFLNINFCARVVLDLEEYFPKEIIFRMVEGDFREFSGSWQLKPCVQSEGSTTHLIYTARVWPRRTMPVGLIERCLSNDMRLNLASISHRVGRI